MKLDGCVSGAHFTSKEEVSDADKSFVRLCRSPNFPLDHRCQVQIVRKGIAQAKPAIQMMAVRFPLPNASRPSGV